MEMSNQYCVPPGFRFHPTEEELVGYYLKRKVESRKCDFDVIVDIDLYRMEPWEIECRCKLGYEEENEWFFFGYKDRKYPTGNRTNRATALGFWKATGRDKAVFSSASNGVIIGMRKTLVFYKGRAPNGTKTNWIIHEYRLQHPSPCHAQEEGWVVCRAFKKPSPLQNRGVIGPWTNNGHYYHNNNSNNNGTSFKPTAPENGQDRQATCSDYRLPIIGSDQSFSSSSSRLCSDEVLELPLINSPMTITTSIAATNRDHDFENGIGFDWYKDWENIEDILEIHQPDPHPYNAVHYYEQINN